MITKEQYQDARAITLAYESQLKAANPLQRVKKGDRLIYWGGGRGLFTPQMTYIVSKVKSVSPSRVSVLIKNDEGRGTLVVIYQDWYLTTRWSLTAL